jgi:hypothetical protein
MSAEIDFLGMVADTIVGLLVTEAQIVANQIVDKICAIGYIAVGSGHRVAIAFGTIINLSSASKHARALVGAAMHRIAGSLAAQELLLMGLFAVGTNNRWLWQIICSHESTFPFPLLSTDHRLDCDQSLPGATLVHFLETNLQEPTTWILQHFAHVILPRCTKLAFDSACAYHNEPGVRQLLELVNDDFPLTFVMRTLLFRFTKGRRVKRDHAIEATIEWICTHFRYRYAVHIRDVLDLLHCNHLYLSRLCCANAKEVLCDVASTDVEWFVKAHNDLTRGKDNAIRNWFAISIVQTLLPGDRYEEFSRLIARDQPRSHPSKKKQRVR